MLQKNFPSRKNDRRIKVLARLKEMTKKTLEITDSRRINKEIQILEAKITTPEEARGIRSKKDRSAKSKEI